VAFFGGKGPDVVLECAGTGSALQPAIDLVRPFGRVALVGIDNDSLAISAWNIVLKGAGLLGVLDLDFGGGMELIRQKKVDCREFLTEIIALDRIQEAFETLLKPVDEEKIVIAHEHGAKQWGRDAQE